MTHDEMIEVIQAHKEGKVIEYKVRGLGVWTENPNPAWEFATYDYRVKRELREFWINVYGKNTGALAHESKRSADAAAHEQRTECIHVKEVD